MRTKNQFWEAGPAHLRAGETLKTVLMSLRSTGPVSLYKVHSYLIAVAIRALHRSEFTAFETDKGPFPACYASMSMVLNAEPVFLAPLSL
jgi:hypothetical protein